MKHCAFYLWQLRIEHICHIFILHAVSFFCLVVFLLNQTVYCITVNTRKTTLLQLLLIEINHGCIELSVKKQNTVTLRLGIFYICILCFFVISIEIYSHFILVGLIILYKGTVFLKSEIFSVHVLEKSEILGTIIEIGLRKHAVVYKDLQVVPFAFKVLPVVLKYALQTIGNFFGYIRGYFLYIRICLQITATYIQRNVRRIDYTMEQSQKIRHYVLNIIGYEHLITVKLNFISLQIEIILDFREIQNAR